MNVTSKNTLKAAAVAAGLVAVLLPTGCASQTPATLGAAAQPGPADTVVVPPTG